MHRAPPATNPERHKLRHRGVKEPAGLRREPDPAVQAPDLSGFLCCLRARQGRGAAEPAPARSGVPTGSAQVLAAQRCPSAAGGGRGEPAQGDAGGSGMRSAGCRRHGDARGGGCLSKGPRRAGTDSGASPGGGASQAVPPPRETRCDPHEGGPPHPANPPLPPASSRGGGGAVPWAAAAPSAPLGPGSPCGGGAAAAAAAPSPGCAGLRGSGGAEAGSGGHMAARPAAGGGRARIHLRDAAGARRRPPAAGEAGGARERRCGGSRHAASRLRRVLGGPRGRKGGSDPRAAPVPEASGELGAAARGPPALSLQAGSAVPQGFVPFSPITAPLLLPESY